MGRRGGDGAAEVGAPGNAWTVSGGTALGCGFAALRRAERHASRVIVEIASLENGCMVTLIHEMPPKWAEFVGRAEEAWSQMLDVLVEVLA